MEGRLSIDAITPENEDWTCKVQVVDKGRPRENLQKTKKYQLMLVQDEKETQVQCIIFGADITHYAEKLFLFHTYLISVPAVNESNTAYGIPINSFTWIIDKGTIVEPIEEINPPESSLSSPTRWDLIMFDDIEHQSEGSEFDMLAIVVNMSLPTYAANGSRIQELIIMDNQIKSNQQLLVAHTKRTTTPTGALQFIPFEDEIISIVDAQKHAMIFARLHSRRRFYCATCHRSTNLIPSGSATAFIVDECAKTILHLTAEEIYDIRCIKKQMLPLANVRNQLTGKTFTIHAKRSFAKTVDGSPGKLINLSYMEKETLINAISPSASMDTTGSSKRKIEHPVSKIKDNKHLLSTRHQ